MRYTDRIDQEQGERRAAFRKKWKEEKEALCDTPWKRELIAKTKHGPLHELLQLAKEYSTNTLPPDVDNAKVEFLLFYYNLLPKNGKLRHLPGWTPTDPSECGT